MNSFRPIAVYFVQQMDTYLVDYFFVDYFHLILYHLVENYKTLCVINN